MTTPKPMKKTQRVTVLPFSVRTQNCLKAEEIRTIGELVSHSAAELYKLANIGKRTLREIEDVLAQHHLSLRADS
jgi:DNA-directed RNA polymerase subunit alpha